MHFLLGLLILAGLLSFPAGRLVLLGTAVLGVLFLILILLPVVFSGPSAPPTPAPISAAELAANAKLPCWKEVYTTEEFTADKMQPRKPGQLTCPPPPRPVHLAADCNEIGDLLKTVPGPVAFVHDPPSDRSSRMNWYNGLTKGYQDCLRTRLYRTADDYATLGMLDDLLKFDVNCRTDDSSLLMLPGPDTAWFAALSQTKQHCIRAGAFMALHALPSGTDWAALATDTGCLSVEWTAARMPWPGPARAAFFSALPKTELACIASRLIPTRAAAR